MTEYFTELFKTSCTDWEPVVACVHRKVSRDQNDMMVADIEDLEVKNALFHMHPDKSPGPDGMTPGFYQNFWHIVGKDIVEIIKRFSATGHIENQLQGTNIVLIPKKKNAKVMTDLRPISLCNVVYKIISKVLANRMKKLIDSIISDTQSVFIPGRLITDNIMVAYELMHFLK